MFVVAYVNYLFSYNKPSIVRLYIKHYCLLHYLIIVRTRVCTNASVTVCVRECVCACVYVRGSVRVCTWECACVCVRESVCACEYVRMCVCLCVQCLRVWVRAYVRAYVRPYVRAYVQVESIALTHECLLSKSIRYS